MVFYFIKCYRYMPNQIQYQCLLRLIREKSQRAKAPPVPKEKELKWQKKKQIIPTDTPDFWGLGLTDIPVDNVWNRRLYKPPYFTLTEALKMHRELASPEMTDNMDGIVVLDAQLDLTTKKKTKFLGLISGIVLLPHNYDNMIQGRVLTITKSEEDQRLAAESGAVYSGGLDLIRKVERGDISADEYDCVVINPDLLLEATILKRVLQDRFPSKKKGNLGNNITEMVNLFTNGRQFESSKMSDAIGKILMPFGKLSMNDEALYENLISAVEAIRAQKPNSNLISQIGILCPPSKEIFLLKDEKIFAVKQTAHNVQQDDIDEEVEEHQEDNINNVVLATTTN